MCIHQSMPITEILLPEQRQLVPTVGIIREVVPWLRLAAQTTFTVMAHNLD